MFRLVLLDPLQSPEAVVLDDLEDEVGVGVVVIGAAVLVLVVVFHRHLEQLLEAEHIFVLYFFATFTVLIV